MQNWHLMESRSLAMSETSPAAQTPPRSHPSVPQQMSTGHTAGRTKGKNTAQAYNFANRAPQLKNTFMALQCTGRIATKQTLRQNSNKRS